MKRYLLAVVAAAIASLSVAEAQAQHPHHRSGGVSAWGQAEARRQNAATNAFIGGIMAQRPIQRSYYSSTLSGPGYSYTQGYGPFGSFNQNTLYGSGYSYTSGYGVPSYGPVYGGYGGYGAGY